MDVKRLGRMLDYSWPILGGLAAVAHSLLGDERMARWLRTNADYEPEPIA